MSNKPLQFGQYYHIFNRGTNGENIFKERRNYPFFLQLYSKHISPVAQTFAYCLLPNHFHFAIRTYTESEQTELANANEIPLTDIPYNPSRAFNNLFIAYSKALNKSVGRTGALFERPFGRKHIENDVYLSNLIVYIHQNPQKHGIILNFRDWTFSSWNAFYSEAPTKLQKADVIDWFGNKEKLSDAHLSAVDERRILHLIEGDFFEN